MDAQTALVQAFIEAAHDPCTVSIKLTQAEAAEIAEAIEAAR